jgi:very-short-patch-repair endonuclease
MTIRPSKRPSRVTKDRVKRLRTHATEPEKILWDALRARNVGGLKFRRQHPIEPYIADYYCAEAMLVVELDGESHNDRQDYDARRDECFRKLGLTVMRLTNHDVITNIDGVATAILTAAFTKMGKPLPRD